MEKCLPIEGSALIEAGQGQLGLSNLRHRIGRQRKEVNGRTTFPDYDGLHLRLRQGCGDRHKLQKLLILWFRSHSVRAIDAIKRSITDLYRNIFRLLA
jgi:hypothetical protein